MRMNTSILARDPSESSGITYIGHQNLNCCSLHFSESTEHNILPSLPKLPNDISPTLTSASNFAMAILKVGDTLPAGNLEYFDGDKLVTVHTEEWGKNKKVILVGIPGAFTPTCRFVNISSQS